MKLIMTPIPIVIKKLKEIYCLAFVSSKWLIKCKKWRSKVNIEKEKEKKEGRKKKKGKNKKKERKRKEKKKEKVKKEEK